MSRTAMLLAMLVTCSAAFSSDLPVTVSGTIALDDTPLPGATVRLLVRGEEVASTVTDVDGRYSFADAPRGWYELEASLDGLESVTQEIRIGDADQIAETIALRISLDDPITIGCGSPCDGEGLPSCDDYKKNRSLEESSTSDPRALNELRDRYSRTTSREERARIGGFLVAVLDDDDEYFQPLVESAELVISFAERSVAELNENQPDYVAWCNLVGRDPEKELWILYDEATALLRSTDSRAFHYAHRALRTRDLGLQYCAIELASLTCDASLLAAIGDDFESLAEHGGEYAMAQLIPCGDPALNARILAIEDFDVEQFLPDIIEARNEQLARLRPLSH